MDLTGLGSAFEFAKGVMDRFWPPQASESDKMRAVQELARSMEERENQVIEAQKEIIVAEMSQGDQMTKRARPTIVYAGLAFIFLVHVFLPIYSFYAGRPAPELGLPSEFWWAWTSVVGIWAIGRSAEKRGAANKVIEAITGHVKKS